MRASLSRLCGKVVICEGGLSVSSESVGLVGGVLVLLEVGAGAEEEVSSVSSCLALGSAARPRLRRVFAAPRAVAFARAAVFP